MQIDIIHFERNHIYAPYGRSNISILVLFSQVKQQFLMKFSCNIPTNFLIRDNSSIVPVDENKKVIDPSSETEMYSKEFLPKSIGSLLYDPYNPLNIQITPPEIEYLLQSYGIPKTSIHNFQLYRRAFIHRSYMKHPAAENQMNHVILAPQPNNCLPLATKSNKRLEFLGDGVLECITKYYLYRQFPKENEDAIIVVNVDMDINHVFHR